MKETDPTAPSPRPSPGGFAVAVAQNLRFYSRLPVPRLPFEADPHARPDFARLPVALPVAGAIIGATGALALLAALRLGLPSLAAAGLAVAVLVAATGAFHEDGLADTVDGFGGGGTVARRLEIMRDSRVGSYGAAALCLSLILRVSLLAAIAEAAGAGPAALATIVAASTSRVAGLIPVWALPNARADGKSAAVGRPANAAMGVAMSLALAIALALLAPSFGAGRALLAFGLACLSAWPVCRLSKRLIGGQTGDVAGAAQQLAEVAMLLVLAARLSGSSA